MQYNHQLPLTSASCRFGRRNLARRLARELARKFAGRLAGRLAPKFTRQLAGSSLGAATIGLLVVASFEHSSHAFDELNAAQSLVYDRAHLASTQAGDKVHYVYRAKLDDEPEVLDQASLSVDAATEPERRDVTIDFLSEPRRMQLPPFKGYRGNPLVIAMLEHLAQSVARSAGGGALYVRNRIRDGLARDGYRISEGDARFGDRDIDITTLEFEPFRNDAFLGARPGLGEARFQIVFSDDIPGGILSISAQSSDLPSGDAEPVQQSLSFIYTLQLDDSTDES